MKHKMKPWSQNHFGCDAVGRISAMKCLLYKTVIFKINESLNVF